VVIIVIKNTNILDEVLEDLGIIVPGSSIINLTDMYELYEITASNDLKTQVSIDTLVINDGVNDLNREDGLKHISQGTVYEDDPGIDIGKSTEESITYSESWVEKVRMDTNLDLGSYLLNWSYDIKEYLYYHILRRLPIALCFIFNPYYVRKDGILDCFNFQNKIYNY